MNRDADDPTICDIATRLAWDARLYRSTRGDLLEPGEWATWDATTVYPKGSRAPGGPSDLVTMAEYANVFPDPLAQCRLVRLSGDRIRIGRCLLSEGHADWPGGSRAFDGRRHRVYLFSARDSAAMLEGMRKALEDR